MTDADELHKLRHRLAGAENIGTLLALAGAIDDFAVVCSDGLLGEVADLKDRIYAKLERVGAKPERRRPPTEEAEVFGVAKDDLLLEGLRRVHGKGRPDVAPELETKAAPP